MNMPSTPRTSKIPRPGALSPQANQENQTPEGSPEHQSPEHHPPGPAPDEYPLVSHLTNGLEDCDWGQLQEKYDNAMEQHGRVEENLRTETAKLMEVDTSLSFLIYIFNSIPQVFMAWSQTTVAQDENRALKR